MTQVDIIGYDQINGAINLASLFFLFFYIFTSLKLGKCRRTKRTFFESRKVVEKRDKAFDARWRNALVD